MPRKRTRTSPWSWTTGELGCNRVRIFERRPGGPLQIEWYAKDGSRAKAQSMRGPDGEKLYRVYPEHERIAKMAAESIANAQRQARGSMNGTVQQATFAARYTQAAPKPQPSNGSGRQYAGYTTTLAELFQRYNAAQGGKDKGWSPKTARYNESLAVFWKQWLGEDTLMTDVTEELVGNKLDEAQKVAAGRKQVHQDGGVGVDWRRQRLTYIKAAFAWAKKKARLIPEDHQLTGLDVPVGQKNRRSGYTMRETMLLALAALSGKYDLRVAVAIWIAYVAGRRHNAVRHLTVADVTIERHKGREIGRIWFDHSKDKRDADGVAMLTDKPLELLQELLKQPAVQATGLLFPRGELADGVKRGRTLPMHDKMLNELLREVEKGAGVAYTWGRGLHGLKKRFSTVALSKGYAEAAAGQSGTSVPTLRGHYFQTEETPMIDLSDAMVRAVYDELQMMQDELEDATVA